MISTAHIDDSVVAICINAQYRHCVNASDLYRCTRELWRLKQARAEKAEYAFAVYQGVIREVYEISQWLPASKTSSDFWVARLKSQGRIISPAEHEGRYEFIGNLAPEQIRKKYVGKLIPVRHRQNLHSLFQLLISRLRDLAIGVKKTARRL